MPRAESHVGASRLAGFLLLGLVIGGCRGPKDARPAAGPTWPNAPVVLISIDTLRSDHLPAYGYGKVKTPHLDRLAGDAYLYERAYAPTPMTLPSHTSMLTGMLPPEHGVRNNSGFVFHGESHPSLPRLLKEHGYATGAAVSTWVLRRETGLGALFDWYEDSVPTPPGVATVRYQRPGSKTAELAKAWISAHAGGPFFFFFHIFEPHLPYEPAEPFLSEYGATYEGEIATADAIVGGLLDHLRALGVYDRALIVLVSDHGEGLGEHGEQQHSLLLYREAIQVPLFVKLPGSRGGGSRVAAPAQLSDLLPTVASALGLPAPTGVSGASLFGLPATGPARTIYGETLYPRLQLGWADLRSALDGRWHYIHGPRPELYDLAADPGEKSDLVKGERNEAARLARDLLRFPQGDEKPSAEDAETLKRLAALGYIGGLRDRSGGADLPNPADNVANLRRMEEGWRLAGIGETRKAIDHLSAMVAENPGMTEAWIKLAELHAQEGDDEASAKAYRQAIGRSPVPLPDIALALGAVELRRKRLDDADSLARAALGTLPSRAHVLLSRVALARGDFAAAEREARAAAEGKDPEPPSLLALAEVRLKAGRPAEALAEVERAAALAKALELPSVWDLEFLRGDALARMNRFDEAEAAFRAEIAAYPANTRSYTSLAVLRFMRRDFAGVERALEEMYRAAPTRGTALVAASTLDSLGEKARAAGWRRRADTRSAR